jgi:hypothetical protein
MLSNSYREAGKQFRGADLGSDQKTTVEFKRTFVMPSGRLKQLHGATIEVELEIQGRLRSISGQGEYDGSDPDLGAVLRILVGDPSEAVEFLISESNWSGRLELSELPGCDYRISLAKCAC